MGETSAYSFSYPQKHKLRVALASVKVLPFHPFGWASLELLILEGSYMARRKAGRLHMRMDEDNRRAFEQEAREQGLSLSAWFEALGVREVEMRRRRRQLDVMYPQDAHSRSKRLEARP
jgi:hypothetical protein